MKLYCETRLSLNSYSRIVNILPFETSFVKMFFFWNYLLEMEFSFSVVGRGSNLYLQRKAKWFGMV